ncbi:hypothetical protein [Ramlibacter montanisoli]|uniref:Uncharacterized protein n=1 Tax=Ramlibacter montanisoli TaxID=2732512 RepID=A0A849K974_9BURK|nr:hypothetical protein [Ramlibacter montanisoli]NNU44030.1 hypothetical protein [Ramlibacter montanisoli]
MSIEVPALRLGLAGYTEAQQKQAAEAAAAAGSPRARWELGALRMPTPGGWKAAAPC